MFPLSCWHILTISWGLKQLDYKVYVLGALAFKCRNTYTLKKEEQKNVSIPHLSHLYNVLIPVFSSFPPHLCVARLTIHLCIHFYCVWFFFFNRFLVVACWKSFATCREHFLIFYLLLYISLVCSFSQLARSSHLKIFRWYRASLLICSNAQCSEKVWQLKCTTGTCIIFFVDAVVAAMPHRNQNRNVETSDVARVDI